MIVVHVKKAENVIETLTFEGSVAVNDNVVIIKTKTVIKEDRNGEIHEKEVPTILTLPLENILYIADYLN